LFDDLYVPPEVTEFSVIAGEGANRKNSNIVSAEFKPKKKKPCVLNCGLKVRKVVHQCRPGFMPTRKL